MTIPMAELEIDDVAFLTSDSNGHDKQSSCRGLCGVSSHHSSKSRHNMFRWQKSQILTVACISLFVIITIALIVAFVFPLHDRCSSLLNSNDSVTGNQELTSNSQRLVSTNGELFPWSDIRLPKFIVPEVYDLMMRPNLTTFYNKGSVDIKLKVTEKANFLVIHTKKLNITEILMNHINDGISIPIIKQLECLAQEQLFLQFDRFLMPNVSYLLRIKFERQLEEQLEGFYVSSYLDTKTGVKRYLLTTHFEPTSARSAFPCFDEPAMKASFKMAIVHQQHYKSFFNSERNAQQSYNNEGLVISTFEETVPMSTYLVAFIVCDFNVKEKKTIDGIFVRALVHGDQYSQAEFALQSAVDILGYYQDFFNVTYPLKKLDLVGVPDFGAGAMENWGLVTFRTTMFLYNVNESSSEAKEQVAIVVAHELAHQWFGNLVTMNWWNDLWLNEGFASYAENLGVNYIQPEWKMMDQFVISTTQHAMALDSLQSSHPIMANVKNPSEIEAIFDAISYKKGASLIRMLENFLGMNNLRLGLSKYLRKYQYRTAQTQDLWSCLSEVTQSNSQNNHLNVSAIMDTWVMQKGYPVITVIRDRRSNLILSQKRFLSSLPDSDATEKGDLSPFGYQWFIPITYITDKSPLVSHLKWFNSSVMNIELDNSVIWFKLNVNQTGFYRVNYDTTTWKSLIETLMSQTYNRHDLSSTDRANLIDDAFALMRIGQISVDIALNLTLYLEIGEHDYVPWEAALYHFGILDTIMLQNPLLEKYICKLIQPLVTIWGWNDHSDDLMLVRKLRSLLLNAAVSYGDKHYIQIANRYFLSWMQNNTKIPANLREVVYNTGIEHGSVREWQFCWQKYLNSTVPSEQKLLLGALGATRNAWLLTQYLNYSLDKTKIKTQDTVHVITIVARNPMGKELAWKFVRQNWKHIISLFGQGSFSMDSIITETTWHFSTTFEYNEVKKFFGSVSVGSGGQAVEQSLEKIRANIYWKENIENNVINWLKQFNY